MTTDAITLITEELGGRVQRLVPNPAPTDTADASSAPADTPEEDT